MAGLPLVFLLHGMGTHEKGWEQEEFVAALDAAIETHGYAGLQGLRKKSGSVKGAMDLVPISYGGYFAELIKSWQEKSAEAIALASPAVKPKVERALGWLTKSEMQKNSFVWTHLMDVFFWLTSSNLRNAVKNLVADTIVTKVVERRKGAPLDRFTTSLVSHSLGTAVAHQTIQDIASGAWKTERNGFAPSWFHFDTMHTVANVSRLLHFDSNYPLYDGFVRPGPFGDPASYTLYFCDYRHPLDPFCLPAPFDPPDWPTALFDAPEPSHIHQVNVHALDHYVANPVVHIRMFRGWFGYDCITPKEELDALRNFEPVRISGKKSAADGVVKDATTLGNSVLQTVGSSADIIDILKGVALIALHYQGEKGASHA